MVKERIDQDNYPTPLYSIYPLLERIDFSKVTSFLEPCAGDHRILKAIPTDIFQDFCEIREGIDYLSSEYSEKEFDLIITNPPFSLSIDFVQKSLYEGKTVCYLQRVNWLGSKMRKDFWNSNPPDKIFVLSKRPQFRKELGLEGGTDSQEYAWFIWDGMGIVKGNHIEVL
jgi:hypothetical protein